MYSSAARAAARPSAESEERCGDAVTVRQPETELAPWQEVSARRSYSQALQQAVLAEKSGAYALVQ